MINKIQIQTLSEVKTVTKPWGQEKWIQAGSTTYPYVLKELTLLAGQRTSLQVHKQKSESIYILKGTGHLLYNELHFDCDHYAQGLYNNDELDAFCKNLQQVTLHSGMIFHTPPGTIHRMIATTDLVYIEASTTELDDVVRLQDDNNRTHGRISSEHQ